MTKFQYINENFESIKKEVKMGLVSTSTFSHYFIYSRYDYFRRLNKFNGISILLTADSCRICEMTVYRIIKEMESEI